MLAQENQFLAKLIKNSKLFKDKVALADYFSEYVYGELFEEIGNRAAFLKNIITPGDRLLILFDNRVNDVINHLAAIFAGGVAVPVDGDSKPEYLKKIILDCTPKIVIAGNHETSLLPLLNGFIKLYDDIYLKESNLLEHSFNNSCNVIMYTTGTTGDPKGVMLSLKNIDHTTKNIVNFCNYDDQSFQLITLPISHSFGMGQLYSMLSCGGGVYLEKGMARGKRIKSAFERYQITSFPTTPSGVDIILTLYKGIFQSNQDNIKDMVVNSAPLNPLKALQLMRLMPETKIIVYYGMTEASRTTMACLNNSDVDCYDYVGKALPGNHIRLDEKTTEIIIYGENVALGYWGIENFTKNSEGFLEVCSGDIGLMDTFGSLKIIGRIKEQINIGGFKLSPYEVERVLDLFPGIVKSAVMGLWDKDKREKIVAFIEIEEKFNVEIDEIYSELFDRLESYKVPSEILIINKIPLIMNGKIDRKFLSEYYANTENK